MLHNIAKNRIHAFLIHLLFSALIACSVVLAAILIWYPGPLIDATGAKKIFLMVIGLDVCIGPILTLIIFNKKKKELARDLHVIFIIQVCALVYGIYTLTVARPVYLAFAVDRFEIVQANEITSESLTDVTNKRFKKLPRYKAQWIAALLPEDPEERNDILFNAIDNNADLAQLPKYYHDYSKAVDEIKKRAKPIENLQEHNKDKAKRIQKLIEKYPSQKYGFLPMSGKISDLSIIVDLKTGEPIETIALKPW